MPPDWIQQVWIQILICIVLKWALSKCSKVLVLNLIHNVIHCLLCSGEVSVSLHSARVPLISTKACSQPEVYQGYISPGMICAGYLEGGTDSCQAISWFKAFLRHLSRKQERGFLYCKQVSALRFTSEMWTETRVSVVWVKRRHFHILQKML